MLTGLAVGVFAACDARRRSGSLSGPATPTIGWAGEACTLLINIVMEQRYKVFNMARGESKNERNLLTDGVKG